MDPYAWLEKPSQQDMFEFESKESEYMQASLIRYEYMHKAMLREVEGRENLSR